MIRNRTALTEAEGVCRTVDPGRYKTLIESYLPQNVVAFEQ